MIWRSCRFSSRRRCSVRRCSVTSVATPRTAFAPVPENANGDLDRVDDPLDAVGVGDPLLDDEPLGARPT